MKVKERPINPYRKNSIMWSLMEGSIQGEFDGLPGWSDLTAQEIGEVLVVNTNTIAHYVHRIKQRTGYEVIFRDGRKKKTMAKKVNPRRRPATQ